MSSSPIKPSPRRGSTAIAAALLLTAATHQRLAGAASIHPDVLAAAKANGSVEALFVFADQAQPLLSPLPMQADYHARRRALVSALQARAAHDQRGLRAWFDARGIEHRDFWIANAIVARVPAALLGELGARGDIGRIDPNPQIALRLPPADKSAGAPASSDSTESIPWGVTRIQAPAVWAAGFTGEGVVIGGEDTGYQWDHPALKPQYRGWNGTSVDHNHNWHDAIHNASGNPCGNDATAPCDDFGHGTHTAGTFAGDDGAGAAPRHQTGVAPGARWIGCRNMDRGAGTPARYIECMQWMLAPTDSNGFNPNSDLAPDVVSNSWVCPASEGCFSGYEIEIAVDNLVAAGIFYVAAAGNDGLQGCNSVDGPPAIYDSSFVAGATDANDALAYFSSRGPATNMQQSPAVVSSKMRPDVSAPGVNVYSAWLANTYQYEMGTSMAAPHVAGTAALLLSAFPALKGHPEQIAGILRSSAVTAGVTNTSGRAESCGNTPITQWPNYMAGYGRIDAWNAYHEIIAIDGFDG